MKKRVLSILLVMLMVLSLLPTTALAGTPVFQIDDTGTNTTKKFDALDSTAMSYIKYDCTGAVSITLLDDYNIPDTIDFQGQVLELNLFGHKLYGKVENAENVTVINSTKTKGKLAATGTYKSVETELVDTAYTLTPGTYTATVSEKGETPYTITYYDTYSATDVKAYGGTERTGSAVATAPVNPGDSVKLISGDKVTDIKKTVNTSDTVKAAGFSGWTIDGVPYKVGDSFAPTGTTKDIKVMAAYAPYYTVQYCVTSPIDGTTHKDYYASVLKGESTTLYGAAASSVSGFTGYTLSGWKTVEGNTLTPGESYTPSESLVVLEAVFVQNTCKIKYVNDKDAEITAITQKPATVGATIQLSGVSGLKPAATGHADCSYCVFTGWQLVGTLTTIDAGGDYTVSASDIVDGVITFKATWKHVDPAKNCTIKYYLDAASYGEEKSFGPTTVPSGTAVTLKDVSEIDLTGTKYASGYKFLGWHKYGDSVTLYTTYTATEDTVAFIAAWEQEETPTTYTIKYVDENGVPIQTGSQTWSTKTATAGETIPLSGATGLVAPTGHDGFAGWTIKGTGTTIPAGGNYTVDAAHANKNYVITLVATWNKTPDTYTVKYYLDSAAKDNGSSFGKEPVVSGNDVTLLDESNLDLANSQYVSEGYTLLGWHKADDPVTLYKPGDIYNVTDNVEFIGAWATCKLEYYRDETDGNPITKMDKYVEPGSTIILSSGSALNNPGFTFKGWIDPSSGDVYDPGAQYPVPKDATTVKLYAKWVENEKLCTVTYYNRDGGAVEMTQTNVEKGTAITVYGSATLKGPDNEAGYIFDCWVDKATGFTYDAGYNGFVVNGDVTFYARWNKAPKTYTVTFYDSLGDYANDKAAGSAIGQRTGISSNESITLPGSESYNLASKDFIGWLCPDTNEMYYASKPFTVTGNTDLVAIFKSDKLYKVTYNLAGGTYESASGATEGSIVKTAAEDATVLVQNISVLNDFVRTGYTFKGWKSDYDGKTYNSTESSEGGAAFIMPAQDVTLTAVWEKVKPYTVTYVLESGYYTKSNTTKYSVDVESYNAGDRVDVQAIALKKNGYTFKGWTTNFDAKTYKADGSAEGAFINFTMPEQNVVLTAVWEPIAKYTVTYDLNGGTYRQGNVNYSTIDAKDYAKDAEVTVSDVTLTKGELVFMGWRNSNDNLLYKTGTDNTAFAMPAKAVTLTAEWASKHTVTFDLNLPDDAVATDKTSAYKPYGDKDTKTVLKAQDVKVGYDKITDPGDPASYVVKSGNGAYTTYYFVGWTTVKGDESTKWDFDKILDASDVANGSLTLTALWSTEKHYTVVFKDKITEMYAAGTDKEKALAKEEAQYVLYNDKQLYKYYDTNGEYTSDAAKTLTLEVSESDTIGYGNQTTGADKYPAFERVDYTLGDIKADDVNYRENDWYVTDPLGKYEFKYDAEKSLKANFEGNNYDIDDFADADGVITLWANWTYDYTPDTAGVYKIKIDTVDLDNATYAEYYSDYIVATSDPDVIGYGNEQFIYRNFVLTNAEGTPYTADNHDVSELPDGLYLNKLTGEIYGVPKETGTFTFYVKMESDAKVYAEATEGAKQISKVYPITITIDALPISADRIDNNANIYDKTYGDTDAAAYNLNDAAEQGRTYFSNNLTVTLGNKDTVLADGTAKAVDSGKTNVTLTTSTTDEKVKLGFAYTDAETARKAQIAKGADPKNADWLKCVDMTTSTELNKILGKFADTLTFPVVRTEGEDAGSYKLYLTEDSVKYEYGDAATKANAAAQGENFKAVYDLTIPEAFASKLVDKNAAQYVFTINPVTLTLSLDSKAYTKTYGENDPVYPTSDLTTAATDNTTAGQAATAVTKSASTTLTIKYPMGFTDTLVVAPTREFGEDISGSTEKYALSLEVKDITTTATDKTAKSIAHERETADVKANYNFSLTYENNKLTIDKRNLKFNPEKSTYTYGDLKPGDVLKGSFEVADKKGLANNESIKVVDSAIAKISSTASGAGYLKAGDYTQTLADDRQISFDITNTLWSDETGAQNATKLADTAGNYNATASLKVAKADTLKVTGNIVKVQKGTKPSLDNIKALATLSGVLTNGDKKDDVTLNVKGYSATIGANTVTGNTAEGFVAALSQKLTAGLTDNLTVTVTYAIDGADKDNYVIPNADETVTATLQVYTASSSGGGGGGGGGGSASYKVDVDETTHGDATPDHSSASSGTKVTIDVDPDKGYTVDTVTVKNSKDKEIEVTKKSDTEYTFIMPSGNVTVSATFAEDDDMSNYFVDVNKGDYDYDAVFWAIRKGITEGTDATHFSPDWTCTRGQIVTFLWRAAGSPEPAGTDNPFVDVASSSYYAKAVQWASENGIAKGTTTTTFEPNLTCTRAQCVAFIARALGAKDATGSVSFTDVPSGAWYEGYVAWAVKNGITEGIGGGLFGPDQNCTRGQIVTFLYRAYLD